MRAVEGDEEGVEFHFGISSASRNALSLYWHQSGVSFVSVGNLRDLLSSVWFQTHDPPM